MMKRRQLLIITSLLPGLGLHASAAPAATPDTPSPPGYTVTAEQVQQALAQRFPMRHPVAGLLDLTLKTPQLRLLPDLNRVGSDIVVEAAGPALRRSYTGTLDVDFALRYEASDRSIRAHQLRVHSLRLSGLSRDASELIEGYGPALAAQALREVVLHRLRPQDLALPDSMGLQPDSITVTAEGLVVGFAAKPLAR